MSDNTQEITNEIFERLDAIGGEIGRTLPVVWEKMVTLMYWESMAYLVIGFICLLVSIIALVTFFKIPNIPANQRNYGDPFWPASKFLAGAGAIASMIPAGINLLYPYNWIGVFSPESRLIARLIQMASN